MNECSVFISLAHHGEVLGSIPSTVEDEGLLEMDTM